MKNISGTGASLNACALNAFSRAMQVSAHNVANFSTRQFQPLECVMTEGSHGQVEARVLKTNEITGNTTDISSHGLEIYKNGMDIAKEFASIIENHHGFDANAKVIATNDEQLETILNLSF